MGGLSGKELALKSWQQLNDDDVLGRSGQLAYFFFFAVFPLAIFLTALVGVFVGPGSPMAQNLANYLTQQMPQSAAGLVQQTIHQSLRSSGGGKLTFGIVIALLSASSGMVAMMDGLNMVFGVKEGRSLIKQRGIALFLTIAVGILICIAIALIVVGGNLAHTVAGGALYWVWQIVQYPVAIAFLLFSFAVVYYYAPNVEHPKWHWVTPGAVAGVVLWAIVSFGLRVYLHYFNTYSASYGIMGGVMILLLWFYVTAFAFLMGGEANAIIERAGTGETKQADPHRRIPAAKVEQKKEQQQAQQEERPNRVA